MKEIWLNILRLGFPSVAALLVAFTGTAQETVKPATDIVNSEAQPLLQTPLQPPWQVCNETSFVLNIATVGVPAGQAGQPLSVRGWQSLRPGSCQTINVEKGTPRFVYARSASLHQGGVREWKGRFEYCISSEDFTAKTDIACDLQNMTPAKFLQIIPTESRTAFIEPEDYGRLAETAGLQRLLRDNNYDIKRIDGRTGKRTSQTLTKFFKDHEFKTPLDAEAQFAALEKYAGEAQKTVGVHLCNKSTGKIWAALAYKNHNIHETRGWWQIEKGSCIHPFVENLKGRDAHYYARQETPSGFDKILKASGKDNRSFCIGPSKFSALQQDFCQDRGYVSALFKSVPAGKAGVEVNLTDADFASAAVSGLR